MIHQLENVKDDESTNKYACTQRATHFLYASFGTKIIHMLLS